MTPGIKKYLFCFRRELSDIRVDKSSKKKKSKLKDLPPPPANSNIVNNNDDNQNLNTFNNSNQINNNTIFLLSHDNENKLSNKFQNHNSSNLTEFSVVDEDDDLTQKCENQACDEVVEQNTLNNKYNTYSKRNRFNKFKKANELVIDYEDITTDGRVHSALVSKVNVASRSVTVEWFERGETKGKEIELDAILQLNSNIFQENVAPEPKKQAVTSNSNLSRESSQSSVIEDDAFLDDDENGISQEMVGSTISAGTMSVRSTTMTSSRSVPNPTQAAIKVNRLQNNSTSNITTNGGNRTVRSLVQPQATANVNTHNGQSSDIENIPASAVPRKVLQNSRMTTTANVAAAVHLNNTGTAVVAVGGARRSYVVKEVERLKENREKRRARQAELKEEKTALMNQDPGNPNWELSAMIREYQSTVEFRPIIDGQPIEDHQITVCVRKRPLSRKENNRKEVDVISVPSKDQLIVHEPKSKVDLTKYLENHKFRFDYAFDDSCNNELVYRYTAKPLVQTIFDGGMATCFAYGQTGSGKTHTMGGEFNGKIQDCKGGIYAMAAKDVFGYLSSARYNRLNLIVSASFFEIYSGKVFDLLADKLKLRVLEDGKQQVQVVGLTEIVVDSVEEVLKLIQRGNSTRTSGQTSANANSSRSHAVFQIVLRPAGSSKIHGKFSFIDLAGNERGADTSSADRQTRMEGAEINKSLLALKECIRALGKQNAHLPFRVSKLTQVLRDSFIGEKSKTCMIAMISPGLSSCEHTLNTLRYANRVKELVVTDNDHDPRTDDEQMESDDQKNGSGENGLAQLRSLSEHDMSVELYNQHAAISDLQQAEEICVEQHKQFNDFLSQFLPESHKLFSLANYVDYDQDAYCRRSEEMFTQLADLATQCKDLISEFRSKLAREEMLSHKINPGKR